MWPNTYLLTPKGTTSVVFFSSFFAPSVFPFATGFAVLVILFFLFDLGSPAFADT